MGEDQTPVASMIVPSRSSPTLLLVSAVLCPIGKRWTLWLFFHCLESLSLDLGEGIFMFGALILLGDFPTAHSFAICSTLPSSESTFSSLWKVKIPKKCELLSLAGYP